MNEQQIDLDSGLTLLIRQDAEAEGGDGEWYVWIFQDHDARDSNDMSGTVVGCDESREGAIADATRALEEAIQRLKEPTPAEVLREIKGTMRSK